MKLTDWNRSFPIRTVCEVTREINDLMILFKDRIPKELFEKVCKRLVEQMTMQKKMDRKLRAHKSKYLDELEGIADHEYIQKKRQELHK